MFRAALIAIAAGIIASPAAAQMADWEKPSTLSNVNKVFGAMALFCSGNFGFTKLRTPPAAEMSDKLHAYLLLGGTPEIQERDWLAIFDQWTSLMGKVGSIAQRAADGLEAAADDPDSYAQGEELYVKTIIQGENDAMSACSSAAADAFIGSHYFRGEGTLPDNDAEIRKNFADAVKELRAYKAKMLPPRPR
jgi:hypothetical protein